MVTRALSIWAWITLYSRGFWSVFMPSSTASMNNRVHSRVKLAERAGLWVRTLRRASHQICIWTAGSPGVNPTTRPVLLELTRTSSRQIAGWPVQISPAIGDGAPGGSRPRSATPTLRMIREAISTPTVSSSRARRSRWQGSHLDQRSPISTGSQMALFLNRSSASKGSGISTAIPEP